MNKIYKVMYSKVKQCAVVVSEIAKSHGRHTKSSVAKSSAALTAGVLIALGSFSFEGMPVVQAADGTESLRNNDFVGANDQYWYYDEKKGEWTTYQYKLTSAFNNRARGDLPNYQGGGAKFPGAVTAGLYAQAGQQTVTIGDRNAGQSKGSVFIGEHSGYNNGDNAPAGMKNNYVTSVGFQSDATGWGSIAIGSNATAENSKMESQVVEEVGDAHTSGTVSDDTYGIKEKPTIQGASVALGYSAKAKDGNIAIGAYSDAMDTSSATPYVSVGNGTLKRRITNVANGTDNSDVVTVGQMNDAIKQADNLNVNAGWGINVADENDPTNTGKGTKNVISLKHNLGTGYNDDEAKGMIIGGLVEDRGPAKQYGAADANSVIVGAGKALASGKSSVVVGGLDNVASGATSVVIGGDNNNAAGNQSAVFGGRDNKAAGVASTASGGIMNAAVGQQATAIGGSQNYVLGANATAVGGLGRDYANGEVVYDSAVRGGSSVGIAGGSTGENAIGALAAGHQAVVTTENGTAIGYQATTDEANTIAFGHDAGDVSGYTIKWKQLPPKQSNADGTTNDYTQAPESVTENKYTTAAYNRLVKVADGQDAHDAVVMEQLKPYTKSDASNVGANLKTYTVGDDGETITETDASNTAKTTNENAWGEALGTGSITNDATKGSKQLVTGGTVYSEVRPTTDGTYVKTAQTTAQNLSALDTQVKKNADDLSTMDSRSVKYDLKADGKTVDKTKITLGDGTNDTTVTHVKSALADAKDSSGKAATIATATGDALKNAVNLGDLQTAYTALDSKAGAHTALTVEGGTQANGEKDKDSKNLYAGKNIQLHSDTDATTGKVTYDVKLAKDLTGITSISGSTDSAGAKVTLDEKDKNINVNDGKITNVASGNGSTTTSKYNGTDAKNAANIGDVHNIVDDKVADVTYTYGDGLKVDGKTISVKAGNGITVDKNGVSVKTGKHLNISATDGNVDVDDSGEVKENNANLVTGGTVYTETHAAKTDSNGQAVKYDYIDADATAGENFAKLDTAMKTMDTKAGAHTVVTVEGGTSANGEKDQYAGKNIQLHSDTDATTGKVTYDVKLAKDLTGITSISNQTTTGDKTTGAKITLNTDGSTDFNGGKITNIASNATKGADGKYTVADADKNNAASMSDVQNLIKDATDAANTGLAGKANVDASNIGTHIADATAQKTNLDKWGEAIGTGEVADATNTHANQLVTGKTVYDALHGGLDNIVIGKPGKDGAAGTPGTIGLVGPAGTNGKDGTTVDITIKNGSDDADKGIKGANGVDGKDGITRIVYEDKNGQHQVATMEDGLKFAGDDAQKDATKAIAKKLNNTVDIIGGATGTLTDNNIGVNNVGGKLKVQLVKDLTGITSITSQTTGNTTGAKITLNTTDKNISVNDGKITDVKSGLTATDGTYAETDKSNAANIGDVHSMIEKEAGNTDTKLAEKANVDASNIGIHVSNDTAKQKENLDKWGAAIGTGEVADATNTHANQLVTGKTVYDALHGGLDNIVIGKPGKDGAAGTPGTIGLVGPAGTNGKDGTTVDITIKNGSDDADKGIKGANGVDGKDGITRIVYEDANGQHQVATMEDGLKFAGDDAQKDATKAIAKKLNNTVDIIGGATGTLTDGNIGVNNVDNKLKIQLVKDLTGITSITSQTTGNTTGAKITLDTADKNISVNEGKITNLAPGEAPTDAATVKQVNDVDAKANANSEAIKTNAGNIEKNGAAIEKNSAAIQTNVNNIEKNGKAIEKNRAAIKTNSDNIEKISKTVEQTSAQVATNSSNIEKNGKAIEQNSAAIKTNSGNIEQNSAAIESLGQNKANIDASNIGKNLKGADGKAASADAIKANEDAWGDAIGTGKVESGNKQLVTGDTVYNEVRPTADGSYIKKNSTTAENLKNLDTQVKKTADLINSDGSTIKIGGSDTATKIDISGKDSGGSTTARIITGVQTDAQDATSAANVGYVNEVAAANTQQIYRDMNSAYGHLNNNINKAAAGSNALAALHPLDYDPDDKADFAVGYGHYRNANAAAVGAFYHPNENTMVNVGVSLGNGDPGFNAGVSFKVGRGGAGREAMSKTEMAKVINSQSKEIDALKKDNADKDKRIDALEQKMAEILAKLDKNGK